jgi:hypothetical protein
MPGLALDDNLQSGITYTFTFTGTNVPIASVLADLMANAPSFIGSPSASWTGTQYLNITFNYTGDGSDVVSDVVSEIAQAVAGDGSLSLFQVATGSAGVTAINPTAGGGGPSYSFSFPNLLPSWLGGASVTPAQQAAATAAEKAQVASVATNANAAYGPGSATAVTADQAVQTVNESAASDQANVATTSNAALVAASNTQLAWLAGGTGALIIAGVLGLLAYLFLIQKGTKAATGVA